MNKYTCVALCLFAFLLSCTSSINELKTSQKTKNIILLIGDGMGLTQLSTAYYFGENTPNFSRFKNIGLHQNKPVGHIITDSAAGATAFSIGQKTYNGAIGLDKDTMPVETILEWAAKQNKSTGLIATSSITHATPASFFAHEKLRSMQEEIASDFIDAPVDFAAAGGSKFFNERADGRDLIEQLRTNGVEVSTEKLGNDLKPGNRYAYFLEPDAMKKISEGRGDFLSEATTLGIDFLSKDKDGFFLMVEGSQIDWGGHNNNAQYIIDEVLDFDKAIGLALDFAEKDGNTLVVVTADHETGGFALSAPVIFGTTDYGALKPTFTTGGHTAALIPVLAFGKGAEAFMGFYQNNDIYLKMKNGFIGF